MNVSFRRPSVFRMCSQVLSSFKRVDAQRVRDIGMHVVPVSVGLFIAIAQIALFVVEAALSRASAFCAHSGCDLGGDGGRTLNLVEWACSFGR